jgi:hypothetical protein
MRAKYNTNLISQGILWNVFIRVKEIEIANSNTAKSILGSLVDGMSGQTDAKYIGKCRA